MKEIRRLARQKPRFGCPRIHHQRLAGESRLESQQVTGADQLGWDLFSSGAGLVGHFLYSKEYTTLTGQRASTQTWITQTTTAPDRLDLMRCAYLSALGSPSNDCHDKLCKFYGDENVPWNALRPGWFFVCNRCDVPKKWACCIGYCGNKAVWVPTEKMECLSAFTKVILDMASSLGTGSRLDAQIQALRSQAKDLGDLLKNYKDPKDPNAPKSAKVVAMNALGNEELKEAYAETLLELEAALLEKRISETKDPVLRKELCDRRENILAACGPAPVAYPGPPGQCHRYIEPHFSAPIIQPRLNLNLAPVYLINPP